MRIQPSIYGRDDAYEAPVMHVVSLAAFTLVATLAPNLNAQNYGSPPAPLPESESKEPPLEVKVSAQVRLREEVHRGTFSVSNPTGQSNFDLTHLRNRATLSLRKDNVSAVFQAQDTRWLGEAGTTEDSEGLDLRLGALKIERLAGSKSWIEAGRIILKYGDQRLIGPLEWVNQARTFDGSRLRLVASDSTWLDAFWTVTRETKTDHDDQYFGGVYGSTEPIPGWQSQVFGLSLIDRLEAPGESGVGKTGYATIGTRQAYNRNGLLARFEGAVQVGDKNGDSLLAYGAVLRLGYTAKDLVVEPSVSLEGIYGSGDSDATDGKQGTFQTLFPTNHLHYGYMDLAAWSNLTSVALRAGFKPTKDLKARAAYHHFRLTDSAGGWYDASGRLVRPGVANASTSLGDEVDAVVTWKWRPGLNLELGYGLFVPGDFVKDTGQDDIAHFAYLQLGASLE